MRTLKHLLVTIAMHAALHALGGDAVLGVIRTGTATPLREPTMAAARPRLVNAGDRLRLAFELPGSGAAIVTLSDASGRVLLRERVQGAGPQVRTIRTSHALPGAYTMRIEQEGITLSRKLVIEQA
jgi:hypothetical protein